jgi:DNA-binding response OmpR family regulator
MRTLVIEDDPRMLELLRRGLYERGFTVMTASDGETGLEIALAHQFDSVVLDIGLPRLNGYSLMMTLRSRAYNTPILILTARDSENEIIHDLESGADDYLTKPFSFPEFVARLHSITRGRDEDDGRTIKTADVEIDVLRRSVNRDGSGIELTRLEFRLLESLARRAGECVPRQGLMDYVWGADHSVGPTALDVLVNSLRGKIDGPYPNKLIGTVRGWGYILKKPSDSMVAKP